MKEYLAHSARDGCPSQSYQDHIKNVRMAAVQNARVAACFAPRDGELLVHTVNTAACVHDLGKLHEENQKALQQANNHAPLPINHVDAGVAYLKQCEGWSAYAQMAVYSHHQGLQDRTKEKKRKGNYFRDDEIRTWVDTKVKGLIEIHQQILPGATPYPQEGRICGNSSVFFRMMLSCLADADHSDTARHYGKYPEDADEPALRAEERLQRLEAHVADLAKRGGDNERNRLRMEMFQSCREADVTANIVACDSPVGSGKTTAVMAHLLTQAIRRDARRIFVVLPFTNIIRQSVETYRKALVLPGENPEHVVAELHYRADFENEDVRALTAQWRAPIIVTTAVAFFETLASNRPAALRRLHELPGSLIFVDEAHAALPVKLLPLAWHWMQVLADEWSCYWVLASGSLVEFWNLQSEDWKKEVRGVPQLLPSNLRERLTGFEEVRIQFCYEPKTLSRKDLIERVVSAPGPRLLIMNTVQSAAVMAMDLKTYYGENGVSKVLHLSTALNAEDREKTVAKVKKRLADAQNSDWVLVATSCVEAGVDFSFKTGFREMASLLSLLQAAGRVNRGGSDSEAKIWSFVMQEDSLLKPNPGVKIAAQILEKYFKKGKQITPKLSTESMQKEVNQVAADFKRLLNAEADGQFPTVNDEFCVIDENTVLVIADECLKKQLCYGGCDWRTIQRKAISVRKFYVDKYKLKTLTDGLYEWHLGYDDFLGIMKGVLGSLIMATETLMY